jgi:NADPH-dependent ferric siderophore reductase
MIAEIAGLDVAIVDTGPAVARQVARVAAQLDLPSGSGSAYFWTTGEPAMVEPVARRLANEEIVFVDRAVC